MKRMISTVIVTTVAVFCLFGAGPSAAAQANKAMPRKEASSPSGKTAEKSTVKATFIELGSTRCIPCKMMQPVIAEIEKRYGDQVNVVFYDVWTREGKPYGDTYNIRAIPTQVFLDGNGKEYFRHEGFFPKEEIEKVLRKQGVK